MVNRRALLQMFGIGATITPVVGGAPVVEAAARLLAIPQIDIIHAKEFPRGHSPELWRDCLKWNPYEAIWLYMWQIENNPSTGVNNGIGVLEHLLGREPTQEEKAVGAAIIQWFGCNCGHAFIEEALRASGYRVTYDEKTTSNARQIRDLQHGNIWPGRSPIAPKSVSVPYRGRTIELEYGTEGRVR